MMGMGMGMVVMMIQNKFFSKGLDSKCLGFAGHVVCVITSQICCCSAKKYLYLIGKQINVAQKQWARFGLLAVIFPPLIWMLWECTSNSPEAWACCQMLLTTFLFHPGQKQTFRNVVRLFCITYIYLVISQPPHLVCHQNWGRDEWGGMEYKFFL